MGLSEEDIEQEQIHFASVIATFRNYVKYSLAVNNRRRKDLFTLPLADQALLASLGYKDKLDAVDRAIMKNGEFLDKIVVDPEIFGHEVDDEGEEGSQGQDNGDGDTHHSHSHQHPHHSHSHHSHSHKKPKKYTPTEFDMDKLRSTLKQFVRDWSEEGKEEREASYGPMKEALLDWFKDVPVEERRNFRVLVPGAGLGRLAYDVASLGFTCQGNEFSHYMLLASFLILNKTTQSNEHTIHPYIHTFSNAPTREAMLREIKIPDVVPMLPSGAGFSLVAGDFEEIYGSDPYPERVHLRSRNRNRSVDGEDEDEDGDEGEELEPQAGLWDAVLTCFFMDTAKNIVNYLRIIHRILAPGGVWVNLGPLLWHWENNTTNDPSVELDLEEVKELVRSVGFEVLSEKMIGATYTNNRQGMLGYTYRTAFWTARKVV